MCAAIEHAWAWGAGTNGQLGSNHFTDSHVPLPVRFPSDERLRMIACGGSHAVAITGKSTVYVFLLLLCNALPSEHGCVHSWGWAHAGPLNHCADSAATSSLPLPTHDDTRDTSSAEPMAQPASSLQNHANHQSTPGEIGITLSHSFIARGEGRGGQDQSAGMEGGGNAAIPTLVAGFGSSCRRVCMVAAGWSHTAFVLLTGELFACGDNSYGQLGFGHLTTQSQPLQVLALKERHVSAVACGLRHTLAITKDPISGSTSVFAWGSSRRGQVPIPTLELYPKTSSRQVATPLCVRRLEAVGIVQVAAGGDHSAALTESGRLLLWGRAFDGGDDIWQPSWDPLTPKCRQVALGWHHGLLLTDEGQVWSWGSNRHGQLGRGVDEHIATRDQNWSCSLFNVMEKEGGGKGEERSEGGDGKTEGGAWPVVRLGAERVDGIRESAFIAAGAEHSVAVDGGGHVVVWGWAEHGQLGLGDIKDRHAPKLIKDAPWTQGSQESNKGSEVKVACGSGFCIAYYSVLGT